MRGRYSLMALAVVVIGIIALVVADVAGFSNIANEDAAAAIAGLAILIVIGAAAFGGTRDYAGQVPKFIAIWLFIVVILAALYTWRDPILALFGR